MQLNTHSLQPGAPAPATDSERIAALERQVAELAADRTALRMAFAAGRGVRARGRSAPPGRPAAAPEGHAGRCPVMPAVVLPGRPESADAARDFAAKALAGYPAADDAVLCLDEMVTNAVQHSRSGLPGGSLEVRLTVTAASVLAEVVDDGPLGVPLVTSRESFAERGRGLVLVEALTRPWGSAGNGLWWFWLPLGGDPE